MNTNVKNKQTIDCNEWDQQQLTKLNLKNIGDLKDGQLSVGCSTCVRCIVSQEDDYESNY